MHAMRRSLTLLLILAASAIAADFKPGARVFIEDMGEDLTGYLTAEIQAQEVPIIITRDESTAEFILTGSSEREKRGWQRSVFGGEPDTGTASLYDKATGDLVWSESVGGRSFMRGDFKSRKRIAKKLASEIKKRLNHK